MFHKIACDIKTIRIGLTGVFFHSAIKEVHKNSQVASVDYTVTANALTHRCRHGHQWFPPQFQRGDDVCFRRCPSCAKITQPLGPIGLVGAQIVFFVGKDTSDFFARHGLFHSDCTTKDGERGARNCGGGIEPALI